MNSLKLIPRALVALACFTLVANVFGQNQETVLYSFCSAPSCVDGRNPNGGLIFDKAGNLYGTTKNGGANNAGTVFELQQSNGAWTETVLYSFAGGTDGAQPVGGVEFDSNGNLVGFTTVSGTNGYGTAFELTPPANGQGPWSETILWNFGSNGDGRLPQPGITLDANGNIYGVTKLDDIYGGGTVFQLVKPSLGGEWTENLIYVFGPDPYSGYLPEAGVIFDKSGNLYGTTVQGGSHQHGEGSGVVYKLSPNSQPPWTETVLCRYFGRQNGSPATNLNFDTLGNLYGTLSVAELGNGAVFRLKASGGEYTLPFTGTNGSIPMGGGFIAGGKLYGTTEFGGAQSKGTLYQIQGTNESVLYSFCSETNCTDGSNPTGNLVSAQGSFFGTTLYGGIGNGGGGGVVYALKVKPLSQARIRRTHPSTTTSASRAGVPEVSRGNE